VGGTNSFYYYYFFGYWCNGNVGGANRMTQLLNPLSTHDEPKAATAMRKEQRWRHSATAATATLKKMAVTTEVVLEWFWVLL